MLSVAHKNLPLSLQAAPAAIRSRDANRYTAGIVVFGHNPSPPASKQSTSSTANTTPNIDAYNAPIDNALHQGKYYHSIGDSYRILPAEFRNKLTNLITQVAPQDVTRFQKNGYVGITEEIGDMCFELVAQRALAALVNPEHIKGLAKKLMLQQEQGNKPSFDEFLQEASSLLKPDAAQRLQKMIAHGDKNTPSWDEQKAKNLLSLVIAKFAIFTAKSDKFEFELPAKNQTLLINEANEVNEHLKKHPWQQLKVTLLAFAYTYVPFLPEKWFFSQMADIARETLQLPITYADLMDYVSNKQLQRQEFDFEQLGEADPKNIKSILKSSELLYEVKLLKRLIGHPS